MRNLTKAAIAAFFVFLANIPVCASNRIQYWSGMIPPSQWYNYQERYERLGEGAFQSALLGGGGYNNLSVLPTSPTSLSVQVGPSTASTIGSLFQADADDDTSFGGGPVNNSYALPADPTTIMIQGTLLANTNAIGPLPVPGSNSQISLIECQVSTIDTNATSTNFITQLGALQANTVNRDRIDTVACQYKAGTPSASPTVPAADSGWIGIGYVTIPSGTSTITSGMITALPGIGQAIIADQNGNAAVTGKLTLGSGTALVGNILNYDGTATATTPKNVFAYGTCSATSQTAGPFTGFVATVSLNAAAQFTSVSTSATSFDVGGGASLAANNYWMHDFGSFVVEWNSATTIYAQCSSASQPFHFIAEGY